MRVRVVCSIDSNGQYFAIGDSESSEAVVIRDVRDLADPDVNSKLYFLEADLPIPTPIDQSVITLSVKDVTEVNNA